MKKKNRTDLIWSVDRDKMSQTVRNNWNRLDYLTLTQNIEFL